jgi:two-component system, NtrC family, nitrogen regulation response regulator GlnG
MPRTLLVIDDEESVRYSFRRIFGKEGMTVLTAPTAAEGLEAVREQQPDVVVLDIQLPDRSGLDVFHDIHALDAKRPVIFITAHGTADTAIEAMKGGAFDYLVKPLDVERLGQIIERAFEAARLMHVPAVLPAEEPAADRILGRAPAMQEMSKLIGRAAPQDVNVLILGESGSGKELVARALYSHSRRADEPFLAINCAAIPEALLESELFGHEEGAFTGATRRRVGKFEQCDGGTLFLDEIGDMAPAVQAKMLRVLQEQSFQPLGGTRTVKTDVRVLAATNHDLERDVVEGRFRKDLYYRLKVVSIHVPPLRERRADIPELAHHFLFAFNREMGREFHGFDPEALALFQEYDWPGNVRELQGAIKEAMLRATGHLILAEFLPEALCHPHPAPAPSPATGSESLPDIQALVKSLLERDAKDIYTQVVRAVERVLLSQVLRKTNYHQGQASEILGLNRSTLRYKLRELGISLGRVIADDVAEG